MNRSRFASALAPAMLALSFGLTTAKADDYVTTAPMPGAPVLLNANGIPAAVNTHWPSYSYWTAAYYGYPPRIYIGYGSSDAFPYFGRPYGSPSDPWSWPAMAGYGAGVPTRFYPVLR